MAKEEVHTNAFVRLLVAHQQQLYGYCFALLPQAEDAREILQEAAVTMWRQFGEYDEGRPFLPWARKYVYYTVLSFRKKHARYRHFLSNETLEILSDDYPENQKELDHRLEALRGCVKKLPSNARRLLEDRYQNTKTVQDIARQTGRSANTLYKFFEQMREQLLECIGHALAREAEA